ncbi:MAG: carboxypeptidase-like regulatory domain-containing protein [Bacteroidetes bacterium]|nr:carboxypeptidase-like regulatory domain-containing protein [Bacteroidota bacterium]
MRKFLACAAFTILSPVFIIAQNATIRGTVTSASTGEAVLFGTVYLDGTSYGVTTDINGFYSLTKIPPGTYTLIAQQSNYESGSLSVTVKAGDITTQNIQLKPRVMKEVVISAHKQEQQENPGVGHTSMNAKDITRVVAVGGVADVAQSVQVLPGVVSSGDQGGQLYIRGGTPVQNKVLLDGMIIYNPFHSIGLFSVFDTDIIKNLDVYTGGFNADYGGRISSVMDITTRDGNRKRFGGKITLSPFGSKLMFEGPIERMDTSNRHGSISYVLSVKNSYLRQTSKFLYPYVDSTNGLPFNFNDYYGKVSFNSINGSKLNLFGFLFDDTVTNFKSAVSLKWKAMGFGSNFQVIPGSSTTLIKGNFAYSRYAIGMTENYFQPRNSSVDGFNMGLNFTYFQRKNVINYGLEVLGYSTDFFFENSVHRTIDQKDNTTEFAAYMKYKWISKNWGKDSTKTRNLVIEPGFRFQYYASLNEMSPEPRLAFKVNVNDHLRIKGAAGMYSQNLLSAVSDRDVVNLFYGFLSGSDNIPSHFTNPDGSVVEVKSKLQKAEHAILGVEYDPIDSTQKWGNLEFTLEGYLKDFTELTNLNRNKLYDDDASNADKPDELKKDFIVETGKAYGADFVCKYEFNDIYLWTVYSLGYVTRWDGIESYRPNFDRRHNINVVASYNFGPRISHRDTLTGKKVKSDVHNKCWEVDARWNFGTGFPFTPTQGFYENLAFNSITSNYTSQNGTLGILYGQLNSHQLPTYHRLDITVKRVWEFSDMNKLEVAAGCTNVYNRANVFYFDRVTYKRVNQLPIMPSISMNWAF